VWRCHATNQHEFVTQHTGLLSVEKLISQMNPFHQADHYAIFSNQKRAPFAALKTRRGFHDTRWFYN